MSKACLKKKALSPEDKLSELIRACIIYGADDDGKIAKTKLAKLVYLSDFAYFYDNLKPITGVEYRKLKYGPVSLSYFDKLADLERSKDIEIKKGGAEMISLKGDQKKVCLNESEISLIKAVCDKWKNKPTSTIVDFTHDQFPWSVARENELIPYSLITQQDASTVF